MSNIFYSYLETRFVVSDCSNKMQGSQFQKNQAASLFSRLGQKYPLAVFSCCQSNPMLLAIGSTEFTVCHIILILFDRKDLDKQYLYNAISRARVLCRVHVIVDDKLNRTSHKKRLKHLLRLFQGARIQDEYAYVAELVKLMCKTTSEEQRCACLSSNPSSSSASSASIENETMLQGKNKGKLAF